MRLSLSFRAHGLAVAGAVLTLSIAACVRPSAPPPPPPPAPAPAPATAPVAAPQGDWRDWPITPGTWVYRPGGAQGSSALFGPAQADALFILRCDISGGQRRVILSRAGVPAGPVTLVVRTTSTERQLPAARSGDAMPYVAAALAPADPLLDAMAFSRGRFIVEGAGLPPLAIPAWAEVGRVIEDCRR